MIGKNQISTCRLTQTNEFRGDSGSKKAAVVGGLLRYAIGFGQLFSLLARFHDMNSPMVEPAPDDELAAGAL